MGDMSNATAPLPHQHGPTWDATGDAELTSAVGSALAATGLGERFLTPAAGEEDLAWRVAREGRLWGATGEMVEGSPNLCHSNVAAACEQDAGIAHAYGWALSPDGMWRVHSWGVRPDGTTVETTEEREAYFGVVLTDDERARFEVRDASDGEQVRVHVTFDDHGPFSGETLWATKVDGGYRIDNVPFFAGGFTLGSVVTASRVGGGLEVDRVVSHAYEATVAVRFDDDLPESEMTTTLEALRDLGCVTERAVATFWVAAVPHGASGRVAEVLEAVRCSFELNALEARGH